MQNIEKYYKYILFVLFMVLITGCYNDNGNYDYSEINEVKIKFSHTTNDSLFVASGDTIYLNPEIIYDGDSVNLSYEWKIFDASLTKDLITNEYPKATIISDSCDLCYNVAEGPGQYILVYTVTDKTNQVKFYYSFDVSVQTVKGLAVLDLQNDNSNEIHVIQDSRFYLTGTSTDNVPVVYNLYSGSNSGSKLYGAKSIYRSVWRANLSFVFDDQLYVFGDDVSLKLSTTNYKVFANTMDDFFVIGPNSNSTNVCAQVFPKTSRELINIEGRLFSYARTTIGQTKFGIDIAPGDDYHAAPFLPFFPSVGLQYNSVIYDTVNKCLRPVDQFNTAILNLSDISTTPFNIMNIDMDLKYMENGNQNYTYCVFQDYDLTTYLLVANFSCVSGVKPKPIYKINLSNYPEILNSVDYTFSSKGHVMFYASKTTLYSATYRDQNYLEAISFDDGEEITKIKIYKDDYNTKYDGKLLMIATHNSNTEEGAVYIVQFNGTNGKLDLTTLSKYSGFGKILNWAVNN